MADDPQAYTPEELAALEATAEKATATPDRHEHECRNCGRVYMLRDGKEPSALCDQCSQEVASELGDAVPRLIHQLRQQTARAEAAERDCRTIGVGAAESLTRVTAERDAARTALAAAEVERAKLVAAAGAFFDKVVSLEKKIGSVTAMAANHGFAWPEGDTYNWTKEREALRECLTASPHADLAAVRTVRDILSRIIAMGDTPGLMRNAARNALAALPSWCREQP